MGDRLSKGGRDAAFLILLEMASPCCLPYPCKRCLPEVHTPKTDDSQEKTDDSQETQDSQKVELSEPR
jgi:hypothetical protein